MLQANLINLNLKAPKRKQNSVFILSFYQAFVKKVEHEDAYKTAYSVGFDIVYFIASAHRYAATLQKLHTIAQGHWQ